MALLINMLVILLVFGIFYWIISTMPLPRPMKPIAFVILGLIAILFLLNMLGLVSISGLDSITYRGE